VNIVSDPGALAEAVAAFEGVDAIGVDTEADSFHSYREKTCLLQISAAGEDYILDPLALNDLSPLSSVFDNPAVRKVFHAAENDVAGLRRDFGFQTRCLFDTMLAARILGFPKVGLADLLRDFFAVETNKRYQRHDWGHRPLDRAALDYAAVDSRYLVALSNQLSERLEAAGRLEEAEEEFTRLESASARERSFDPESFWRLKGAFALDPRGRAVLRELFIWRDRQAAALDVPPFRVAPDSALHSLAQQRPEAIDALQSLDGLPLSIARRHGPALMAALKRGLRAPDPTPPAPRPRDEAIEGRYEALRAWRRATAAERGVEPDVVVSNAALRAAAGRQPRTLDDLAELAVIGPWKLKTYGPEILRTLWGGSEASGVILSS
jgi:ribonuclease D